MTSLNPVVPYAESIRPRHSAPELAMLRRPANRRSSIRTHRLLAESLEPRLTMDGTVVANLIGTNLVLTGDNANNVLTISDTDFGTRVSPDGSTRLRVDGNLLAPGAEFTFPGHVTGNVTAHMLGGDDELTFQGVEVNGYMYLHGGSGDNFLGVRDIEVGGNFTVRNDAGNDFLNVLGQFEILGSVYVNNGSGNSMLTSPDQYDVHVFGDFTVVNGIGDDQIVFIEQSTISQFAVGGRLVVKSGATATDRSEIQVITDSIRLGGMTFISSGGSDFVDLRGLSAFDVDDSIFADLGGGSDVFGFQGNAINLNSINVIQSERVELLAESSLGIDGYAAFNSATSSGVDVITLSSRQSLMIDGPFSVSAGSGESDVQVQSSDIHIKDVVVINTGNGTNDVVFENYPSATAPEPRRIKLDGRLTVNGGENDDRLMISADNADRFAMVDLKEVALIGKAGNDRLQMLPERLSIHGQLIANMQQGNDNVAVIPSTGSIRGTSTILFGSGDDEATLAGQNQNLRLGALTITGGSGEANVNLRKTRVYGTTYMSLGGGTDTVFIDDSRFGVFTLLTGAGPDDVQMEQNDSLPSSTRFEKSVIIDMGSGNDNLSLGVPSSATRRVQFRDGPRTLNGGAGNNDQLSIGNVTIVNGPVLYVVGFE